MHNGSAEAHCTGLALECGNKSTAGDCVSPAAGSSSSGGTGSSGRDHNEEFSTIWQMLQQQTIFASLAATQA